jgi:hypothetical protein
VVAVPGLSPSAVQGWTEKVCSDHIWLTGTHRFCSHHHTGDELITDMENGVSMPHVVSHTVWIPLPVQRTRGARFGVRQPCCRIQRAYRQARLAARTRIGT